MSSSELTLNDTLLEMKREQLLTHINSARVFNFAGASLRDIADRIVCLDGFTVSVQAGRGFRSIPDKISRVYSHVEVGFPSEKEELLIEYAEEPDSPTTTVYNRVPLDTVIAVLDKHGGPIKLNGCSLTNKEI